MFFAEEYRSGTGRTPSLLAWVKDKQASINNWIGEHPTEVCTLWSAKKLWACATDNGKVNSKNTLI